MRYGVKLTPGAGPGADVGLTIKMRPLPKTIECDTVKIEPEILGYRDGVFYSGGVDYPYVAAPSETIPVLLSLSQYISGSVVWTIAPSGYPGLLSSRVQVFVDHPQFALVYIATLDGSPWWGGGYQKEFALAATGEGFETEKFIVVCHS